MDVYEPRHLLKFVGNPELELYYRYLVYNHRSKDSKTNADQHRCGACNTQLSVREQTRLKPRQRMTKTIQKLIAKRNKKIPLSRIELYKLNKFMDSSQQMVMRCPQCTSINKVPIAGRRDVIKMKNKLISEVEERLKEESEASTQENGKDSKEEAEAEKMMEEEEGNGLFPLGKDPANDEKSKKKRKKKKTKKEKDFVATLIHQKASEKKAKMNGVSVSTPVSLRHFVLSETNVSTPSPSHSQHIDMGIEIFHKALGNNDSFSSSANQTPVVCGGTFSSVIKVENHPQSTTAQSSSKKSKKKANKSDKAMRDALFFETPTTSGGRNKISNNQTPTSANNNSPMVVQLQQQQQLKSTPSSKRHKKKIVQKELRKYLTGAPQLQEKTSSSLKDFLTSL